MQPEDRNAAYLWDMLDAARSILNFVEGKAFESYLQEDASASRSGHWK